VDDDLVGIYGLAYQLTAVVTVLAVAVNQAVMPRYARATSPALTAELRTLVTSQALVIGFVGLSTAVLGPPLVHLILPPSYQMAAEIVPPIALGFVFFGWYLIPMDSIVLVAGRTRWIFVCTLVAAGTNIALNLVLIPRFGVMAAAVNTAVGYAVLLVLVMLFSWRQTDSRPPIDWPPILLGCGTIAVAYALAVLVTPEPNLLALTTRTLVLLAVIPLLTTIVLRRSTVA
jgi:O-antigen/teichoic acid export membrane protein